MIPKWIKKLYKDPGSKLLTYFLLLVGPIWSILSYLIDPSPDAWTAWAFFWGFYLVVFLPLAYFNRNTP